MHTIMALEAACDDTSTMLTQIHEVKSFLTQQTASSSRGPCSLSHERANIETQICAARAYAAKFNNNEAILQPYRKSLYTIQWCKTQASKDQDKHTG